MSTTQTSSLLKTKNSTKLVKRFLQRTSDWHISSTATNTAATTSKRKNSQDDAEKKRQSKKRKRQLEAQLAADAAPAVDEGEIVERHIQTLLSVDATMQRPPTKSLKKRPHKKSNMETSLKRLDRDHRHLRKQRLQAKAMAPVGSGRSSAVQSRTIHVRTHNKKDHEKQTKEQSLQRIAKLLKQRKIKQSKRR